MKNLIALFCIFTLLFASCVAPDKQHTTVNELTSLQRPDNPLDWEIKMVDTTGMKATLINGTYVQEKATWQKQLKIPRSNFQLIMSGKQVKHFMKESGYFHMKLLPGIAVSIIIIVLAILFLKGDWMRFLGKGGALGLIIGTALTVNIRIYQKAPSELADNNKKILSRTEYETELKRDSTFDTFWKEKWERNELVTLTNKKALWKSE